MSSPDSYASDRANDARKLLREPGQMVTAAYRRRGRLRYGAENREIVGRNQSYYNNRPLYCPPPADGVVLAGDRPLLRFLSTPYVHGQLALALLRDGQGKWFHEYEAVESRYRCGRMHWRLTDASVPGLTVSLDAVALSDSAGMALRLQVVGARAGDRLVWVFGGASHDPDPRTNWDPVMRGNPDVCKKGDPRTPQLSNGLDPERCRGNAVHVDRGPIGVVLPAADAERVAVVACDRGARLHVADAACCKCPPKLPVSVGEQLPILCGVVELQNERDPLFLAAEAVAVGDEANAAAAADPAGAFGKTAAYLDSIEVVRTETPSAHLDAAVASVCHAMDGACARKPFDFLHGCMSFHVHFLGWRVICGSTALGWHDRVLGNAAFNIAGQVVDDDQRPEPQPNPQWRYCRESEQSRFRGRGHINSHYGMYNVQTQFFDQTIRDWRWTADPEMERILRPALELHLEWARECFDPDNDGLYESYANTLPTDSVWYSGGGGVEESAYAYYAHRAAMDMAQRAGDAVSVGRHRRQAETIRRALIDVLWLADRGHFGLYVEQAGHRRVHSDAWVYSQFLPIDAGITTEEQALQALYYTEWALERIPLPFGGVLCQPSNWVPSKWSVRDMFNGDMWHLALAYFQTGLGDDGWQLLLGAMLETAYASATPGGFSHIGAGTDFSDSKDMFARAVVEGLFGYDPDYPNGIVSMRPAFPSSWPRAAIATPDYAFEYRQSGSTDVYRLSLTRAAQAHFRLPVRAKAVRRVTVNGNNVQWTSRAAPGCTWLEINVGQCVNADVEVHLSGRIPQGQAVEMQANVGDRIRLDAARGEIVRWRDPHDVLADVQVDDGRLSALLAPKTGHHLVLTDVRVGDLTQRQVFKLHITDAAHRPRQRPQRFAKAPDQAAWHCVNVESLYNGDVRDVFKQQYLSPRPRTCSLRLGVDGYSSWCFPCWREDPPIIDLSGLPDLQGPDGRILTPQGVPFAPFVGNRNIALTSLWDNWPDSVTVPVHRRAGTAWLLICGTTFPMQTRIANGVLRFLYSDGSTDVLDLVPPDNYWALSPWGGCDYDYELDGFCLPPEPPPTVQLGVNCRAMLLSQALREGIELSSVTIETLSQEVVIGLMGLTLESRAGKEMDSPKNLISPRNHEAKLV